MAFIGGDIISVEWSHPQLGSGILKPIQIYHHKGKYRLRPLIGSRKLHKIIQKYKLKQKTKQ